MKHLESLKEYNEPKIIKPTSEPGMMSFWHGGRLDTYNDTISQKNGRYEYGAGLYLTTSYDVVSRYSKGSRKLYLVTVEEGNDITKSLIAIENIIEFVKKYIRFDMRKNVLNSLEKYIKKGQVKAYIFNTIVLNTKAIKPSNTQYLRQFFIDNNIDYEIVDNAFGYHEKMMVLYNMDKIYNHIVVNPKDTIEVYDLSLIF